MASPCSDLEIDTEFEHDLFTIGGLPRSGVFNLGTTDILHQIILGCDEAALCIVGYLPVSLVSTH